MPTTNTVNSSTKFTNSHPCAFDQLVLEMYSTQISYEITNSSIVQSAFMHKFTDQEASKAIQNAFNGLVADVLWERYFTSW